MTTGQQAGLHPVETGRGEAPDVAFGHQPAVDAQSPAAATSFVLLEGELQGEAS